MAGTDANSITAADLWLVSDEFAFVVGLVGAEERALEVMDSLLDDLAKGLIRWDCAEFTVDGDFQAYPALRTTYATARGRAFFWHRDEHSRVSADWPRSCVAWMGSLAGFGSDGRGNSWPIFDPCASTSLIASGVRFHHGDFVDRLVAQGLMSRPPAPLPSAPRPDPTPITSQVEAVQAAPAKKQRLGSQEQRIAPAALEIYGEDLPLLTPAELKHAIESRLRDKTLKTSVPLDWKVDWEACKRFLRKKGKLRSD
jgi:hypothetical protein